MKLRTTIERALTDPQLLGAALGDLSTWRTWVAVLKAAYGRPLSATEREAFDRVAGARSPPTRKVRQFAAVISRRGGKGRMAGGLVTYESALVDHTARLAPGETGVVACISPTRAQAAIVQSYARGYFEASPILRGELDEVTSDEIRLKNGVVIATLASDFRTLRGRTLLLAVLDEAAYLRSEESATPDTEAARALLPGLSTTGGMLCILSSPYRRAGLLHQLHRDYYAVDSADVLVVQGASSLFNPLLDTAMIEAANAADPQAARSEWFGEFRSDLSQFLDDASIDAAIDHSRPLELPPQQEAKYQCFVDMGGGRHDASTMAVAHAVGSGDARRYVVDLVRGRKGDPIAAAREFVALAREYNCGTIAGDNYGAQWVAGTYSDLGAEYRHSPLVRSDLYLAGQVLFVRGLVSMPNEAQLIRELRLLERRTTKSGKDSVDHPAGATDDYANSIFGALYLVAAKTYAPAIASPILFSAGPSGYRSVGGAGVTTVIPTANWSARSAAARGA
jgi:hypothetical protein